MSIVVASIAVDVVKKNIKNLHLAVLPPDGRVRVSAPSAMSDESIAMFVRTRLEWIRKQQEKFARQPRQSKREHVSGETFYVWGKAYYLQVRYSYRKNTLILDGDKAGHVKNFAHICREQSVKRKLPDDISRFPEPKHRAGRQAATAACGGLTLRGAVRGATL